MTKLRIVIGCVLLASACKSSTNSSGVRMVDGVDTSVDSSLAASTVIMLRSSGKICTGSLIHGRLVVTAAHCVKDLDLTQESALVYFGVDFHQANAQNSIPVQKFFYNKLYVGAPTSTASTPTSLVGDIAVLILGGTAPASKSIAALPIANVPVSVGEVMTLVGAGRTDPGSSASSGILHNKDFTVQSVDSVQGEISLMPVTAGGACQGDSGGPAFKHVGGSLVLLGVASRVAAGCESLAIYTDTRAYVDWLKSFLQDVGGSLQFVSVSGGPSANPPANPPTNPPTNPDSGGAFKLGVDLILVTYAGANWIMIKSVDPSGPAAAAGLAAGDLFKRINDIQIFSQADFDQALTNAIATGSIDVKYRRPQGGQSVDGEVVIPVQ